MLDRLVAWFIRRKLPMEYVKKLLEFGQGHRTQIALVLYSVIKGLEVFGILSHEQTAQIHEVLLPLAGAAFAAKVNRVGNIAQNVVGDQNPK